MERPALDRDLLERLELIPEVALSGFTVREGLAATGVTLLRGHTYIGSWRATEEELIWVPANLSESSRSMPTVDEAVRFSLLLILQNLEAKPERPRYSRLAG